MIFRELDDICTADMFIYLENQNKYPYGIYNQYGCIDLETATQEEIDNTLYIWDEEDGIKLPDEAMDYYVTNIKVVGHDAIEVKLSPTKKDTL